MSQEIALSTAVETWPTFSGETWEAHVTTWVALQESMEGHLWQMGAIAASLYEHFGSAAVKEFAAEVNTSWRRVQEYAHTYNEWTGRERSRLKSFGHHTIAARSDDPERWIQVAEDERLSTRELERYIQREARIEAGGEPEPHLETCPTCKGVGVIEVEG